VHCEDDKNKNAQEYEILKKAQVHVWIRVTVRLGLTKLLFLITSKTGNFANWKFLASQTDD
jgi:hypothetical protein